MEICLTYDLAKHGWTQVLLLSIGCGMFAFVEDYVYHRYAIGKRKSILIAFLDNWRHSALIVMVGK